MKEAQGFAALFYVYTVIHRNKHFGLIFSLLILVNLFKDTYMVDASALFVEI